MGFHCCLIACEQRLLSLTSLGSERLEAIRGSCIQLFQLYVVGLTRQTESTAWLVNRPIKVSRLSVQGDGKKYLVIPQSVLFQTKSDL